MCPGDVYNIKYVWVWYGSFYRIYIDICLCCRYVRWNIVWSEGEWMMLTRGVYVRVWAGNARYSNAYKEKSFKKHKYTQSPAYKNYTQHTTTKIAAISRKQRARQQCTAITAATSKRQKYMHGDGVFISFQNGRSGLYMQYIFIV